MHAAPAAASASTTRSTSSARARTHELVHAAMPGSALAAGAASRSPSAVGQRVGRRPGQATSALVCATKCAIRPRIIRWTSAPLGSSRGHAVHAGQQQRVMGDQQLGTRPRWPRRRVSGTGVDGEQDRAHRLVGVAAHQADRVPRLGAGAGRTSSPVRRSARRVEAPGEPTPQHAGGVRLKPFAPRKRILCDGRGGGRCCSSTERSALVFVALWLFCLSMSSPPRRTGSATCRRSPGCSSSSCSWSSARSRG